MKREELQEMKVDDLRKYASSIGVKNSRRFKKAELIETILGAEKSVESDESATDENKIDNSNAEAVDESEKKSAGVDMEQKMPYIESAKVGTLVAFRLPNGRVKSAKIIKKSTNKRKFMVETNYGAQYVIRYEDVVWVRSGKRWPRGVYKLLKGLVEDGATES